MVSKVGLTDHGARDPCNGNIFRCLLVDDMGPEIGTHPFYQNAPQVSAHLYWDTNTASLNGDSAHGLGRMATDGKPELEELEATGSEFGPV